MRNSRVVRATVLTVATLALVIFLGNAPSAKGGEANACRDCINECGSGDFCWCATQYCNDVCSRPPDCPPATIIPPT